MERAGNAMQELVLLNHGRDIDKMEHSTACRSESLHSHRTRSIHLVLLNLNIHISRHSIILRTQHPRNQATFIPLLRIQF